MRLSLLCKSLSCLALLAVLAGASTVPAADKEDEGFKELFNGKDFTGWKMILRDEKADPTKTFSVKDGIIVVTGTPNGYFHTDKSYKNYVLRFDWKFKRPEGLKDDKDFKGNSGCLVHIQEPHKVWPRSVEVQGMNSDHGHIFAVNMKGEKATKFTSSVKKEDMQKAQKDAIKPVGEWNTTEITCQDGKISSKVNGKPIDTGEGELKEGPFLFQSEGAEIYFKNIKIKELK